MLRPVQVRRAPHLRQLLSARSTEPGRTMAPYSRKSPWPDQTGVVTRREPEWRAARHVRGFPGGCALPRERPRPGPACSPVISASAEIVLAAPHQGV